MKQNIKGENMKEKIKVFRDGIFALHTRRFGTIAELMIEDLYDLGEARDQFHDRYDNKNNKRIEIKFSRVLKSNKDNITFENAIESCLNATTEKREFNSSDIKKYEKSNKKEYKFNCNIQQIKTDQFDILYYGLFFSDKIEIFSMTANQVKNCEGYSNKQHKGNVGEGQLHLNNKSIDYHFKNHQRSLTYEELYHIFEKRSK